MSAYCVHFWSVLFSLDITLDAFPPHLWKHCDIITFHCYVMSCCMAGMRFMELFSSCWNPLASKTFTMPGGVSGKESARQSGDTRDATSIPGVGTIPWRRKWQLTPVFLVWKTPWTEEPGGLQSTGSQSWTRQGHYRGMPTLSGISPVSLQDGGPEVIIEFLVPGV